MRLGGWSLVSLVLATGFAAGAGKATTSATAVIAFPASGNLSVAQLTIAAKAGAAAPTLRLAGRTLPASAFVVGGIARDPASKTRFIATIAVFNRPPDPGGTDRGAPAGVAVRLPAAYTVTRQSVSPDVLYQNPRPASALPVPAVTSVLGGTPPPKIAARRLLVDARKLALDESAPVAEMELLGFPYVSAELAHVAGTKNAFVVTIGLANLAQVNSVRLTFPAGTTFAAATAPPLADASPMGATLQLSATQGFVTEASAYRFTFNVNQALSPPTPVPPRASTHYFENVLPFTERLWIPG